MKNVAGISLILLTACNGTSTITNSKSPSSSVGSSNSNVGSSNAVTSSSSPVYTKYLYSVRNQDIFAYPIDSSTGDLIQPEEGSWYVGINNASYPNVGNFLSMWVDSSGKNLYAFASGGSANNGYIFQYQITQNTTFSQGSGSIPLIASNPVITPTSSLLLGVGTDGLYYVTDSILAITYNQFTPSNGALNLTSQAMSLPSGVTLSTTVSTSVSTSSDIYMLDTQTNRVNHYRNGLIQQAFNPEAGMPSILAIH